MREVNENLLGDHPPAAYSCLWIHLGAILERQSPRPEFLVPMHQSAVVGGPRRLVSQNGLLYERLHHLQNAVLPLGGVSLLRLQSVSGRCQFFGAVIVNIMDWRVCSVGLALHGDVVPFPCLMAVRVREQKQKDDVECETWTHHRYAASPTVPVRPSSHIRSTTLNRRKSQGR